MSDLSPTPVQPPTIPPRRPGRWLSVLLAVSLLLSGMVIGAGLATIVIVKRIQHGLTHPETFPAAAAGKLRRVLDLTPGQVQAVEAILRRRQASLQEIRMEFRPRLESELDEIGRQIAEVLKPDQAARWEIWLRQKRAQWLPALPGASRPPTASSPS